jgi:hypothetical protein
MPNNTDDDWPPEQPEFLELSKFSMKNGSFKNKLMCQVPLGHLRWLARQHIAKSTKQAVNRYLQLLQTCRWDHVKTCKECGNIDQFSNRHCPECGSQEIITVRQPYSKGEGNDEGIRPQSP